MSRSRSPPAREPAAARAGDRPLGRPPRRAGPGPRPTGWPGGGVAADHWRARHLLGTASVGPIVGHPLVARDSPPLVALSSETAAASRRGLSSPPAPAVS